MKRTRKLLPIMLTIAMGITATFALTACDESYTTTETDNLIAELQATIDGNKSELDEKITALTEEYKAKDSELLAQITANQQAITAMQTEYAAKIAVLELADEANAKAISDLKTEYTAKVEELARTNTDNANALAELKSTYESKVTALEKADSDNKKAIDDLTAEYTAQVESLIAADSKNATALSELKTAYESKVAELTQADETNKKAIEDLTSEYTAKIEELAKADSDNATALAELKAAYESKIATLEKADSDNKKAIEDLEKEYLAKVEELIANDDANAENLEQLREEYEASLEELKTADGVNAKAIADLTAEYTVQVEKLIDADSANATALSALRTEYENKVKALMQADKDNAKAIDELEKAYLAKVEELIANDTANANALAELKAAYESKVTALEKVDSDNKKALDDLTNEYNAKVANFEREIASANATIESNKTELNGAITALTATYEAKMLQIDALLKTLQNTDTTQDEKIAELVSKITALEEATRITDIQFANNGDLIITFGDGTTQTVLAPQKATYTVTFNPNNGEDSFMQTVEEDGKALAPAEPTKDGYNFLGWYISGEEWSFVGYVVTESIELVAKWEESYTKDLEFYYLEDGTYGVKAGKAEYLEEIVIPSTYNGEAVTRILPNAFKEMNITKITIPDSIRYIDTNAFNNCYKLEKINYIGEIDCWAQISFANREANPLCYAKKLYIKEELVTEVRITNATKISNYAFYNCEELKNLSIGDSVVSIGEYSFANTITLEKIIIPANVMEIQPYAFYGSGLKQAILENPTEWQIPTTFTYRYTQRDIRDYGREVTDTYSTRTYDISIPENAAMALCNEVTLQVGHTSLWYGDYGGSVQTDNFLWYTYKWTRLVEEIEE